MASLVALFTACDDGGSSGGKKNADAETAGNGGEQNSSEDSAGSPPNIAGSWSGTMYTDNTLLPTRRSLSASISQDNDAVSIKTSLSGVGSSFSGRISSNGSMTLTDNSTGETWTTYRRPATSSYIEIADFRKERNQQAITYIQMSR
jgi:hypothetical protein